MLQKVLSRVIALPPLLIGALAVLFVIVQLVPGDPLQIALGEYATAEMREELRQELGVNQGLLQQLGAYLTKVVQGNLGVSLVSRQPILPELLTYLPATLELTLFSIFLSVLIGMPLGIISGLRRGRPVDEASRLVSTVLASAPTFWIALVAQVVFYRHLGILPVGGRFSSSIPLPPSVTGFLTLDTLLAGQFDGFVVAISHLILPGLALSGLTIALIVRITRASVLEVVGQDYVRTATAKGLANATVVYKHIMRNALIPLITVLGTRFGALLGGAIVTEVVFSWPGIGRYLSQGLMNMDYPIILGVTLFTCALFIALNLMVDLLCMIIDPRLEL